MVIFSLEEDPNIYISPTHYGNRFIYRMSNFVKESFTRRVIRNIDLRIDRLMIHGTEIKEPMLRRLYESLSLGVGTKMGYIYVNCNGACYFFVIGKGICRPIYNVIFDWSAFGVIVPNSLSDTLRKQLEQKENEVQQSNLQVSDEALPVKDSLEVANKNMKELEYQLMSCRKENEDMITELRKLQDELSSTKDELKSTKMMLLESCEKKANEARDCQSLRLGKREDHEPTKQELLQKVSEQLQSVSSKVNSTNKKLDQALVSKLWTPIDREDLPVFIAIEDVDD